MRIPIGLAGVRVAWVPFVSAGVAGVPPWTAAFAGARVPPWTAACAGAGVPPVRALPVPAVPVFPRSALLVSLRPAVMVRGGRVVPVLPPPAGEPAPMVMA